MTDPTTSATTSFQPGSPITRREALRRTILFSTGLLAAGPLARARGLTLDTEYTGKGLHLLAVGDFGSKNESQKIVAQQMAAFARKLNQPLDAVLALGDNFYGKMTPDRFERDFEKMYDAEAMPCPFYACLGNHDYEIATYGRDPEPRKCEMQLEYAQKNPTSRWKMPAKWYTLELPSPEAPLLKLIVLDSNMQEGALTPQEKLDQKRFLDAEVAKETKAPWRGLMWHHPVFTETTKRKDSGKHERLIGDILKEHRFDFCIAGHDHNMQHLQVEGYSTSFIVSGAGGASRYEVTPSDRGFSRMDLGFNHIHVNEKRIKMQFINGNGECLHTFRRYPDGKVKVVA